MSAEATAVAAASAGPGLRLGPATDAIHLRSLAAAQVARALHPSARPQPQCLEGGARRAPSLDRPPATPEAWSAGLWGSFA